LKHCVQIRIWFLPRFGGEGKGGPGCRYGTGRNLKSVYLRTKNPKNSNAGGAEKPKENN